MSLFPCRRQGGEKLHLTIVALQKHLGDAGSAAEVAVDLERRMCTKKIGVGAGTMAAVILNGRLQQLFQEIISMVAIAQSGPETDFPRP